MKSVTSGRATLLATGTELTSGQIINRNTAWLSAKLQELSIPTAFHLTVPDNREQIRDGLNVCQKNSEYIFVMGGLGPTSDDFTREVAAEWMNLPLEFHPPSWDHIQNRLRNLGAVILPPQKQQAYYPKGALVFTNPVGTANAFYLNYLDKHYWFLPGPPIELEAVWNAYLKNQITPWAPSAPPVHLYMWECLGEGESVIATAVEQILAGSELQVGYRYHRPYVEVKLWVPASRLQETETLVNKVSSKLAPWVVAREPRDVLIDVFSFLKSGTHLWINDGISLGLLRTRLFTALAEKWASNLMGCQFLLNDAQQAENFLNPPYLGLSLKRESANSEVIQIEFKTEDASYQTHGRLCADTQHPRFYRENLILVEKAFYELVAWLRRSRQNESQNS